MAWIDGINAAWKLMVTNGDLYGAIIGTYTNVMGNWFYASVLLIGVMMTYIKTQNFGTTIVSALIISGAAIPFMPGETLTLISIMLALGIALIFYKTFHK